MKARVNLTPLFSIKGMLMASMLLGAGLSVFTEQVYFIGLGPMVLLIAAGLRNIHLIYFLLIACIPFSTELQLTDTLGTDFPDEPLMWFLSLLVFFHLLVYREKIGSIKINKRIVSILLLHLGWILVSSLLSQDPLLSIKYLAAKSWYILAFCFGTWYCLDSRENISRLVTVFLVPMSLVVAMVIFRHFQTGFSFDSVNTVVQPFFRNHVNYGAFLVCLLPLAVAGFILSQKFRWLFALIMVIFLCALFFSYSRGAWMALFTGVLTVLAIRKSILHWLIGGSVLLFAAAVLYLSSGNRYLNYRPDFERTIYHQQFRDHLRATYRLTDLSTAERFHRWIGGIRMTEGHLLHGYGPNGFYYAYKPYTVSAFQTYVSVNEERSTVHNYFLLLLIEQGIPGLVIFCLLLGVLFYYTHRWYHRASDKRERIYAAVVAAMLGMIVSLNLLSDLVETDKIGGLFFLCVGILLTGRSSRQSVLPCS